ncbi:MAG: tRNA glutamyl-Q(34) synthetase GluQRS [Gammaproteobacteria bacterium]
MTAGAALDGEQRARPYRGRFAPSPTGPLHLGSLVAALASWLDARRHGGAWLVRIEDIDPPRERPGAADAILRTLEFLGLHWDEPVLRQSTRAEAYMLALDALRNRGLAYPCGCTRRELSGAPYPGTCRDGLAPGRSARAVRLRIEVPSVEFLDRFQGPRTISIGAVTGDVVLRRADGLWAYNLAVSVDDAWQRISHVVRGADLIDTTAAQIHIHRALGCDPPAFAHVPVILGIDGKKLSKQNRAPPIAGADPGRVMRVALAMLGQHPPAQLARAPPGELLDWARLHWAPECLGGVLERAGSHTP